MGLFGKLFGKAEDPLQREIRTASEALAAGRPVPVAALFARVLEIGIADAFPGHPPHLVAGLVVQTLLDQGHHMADQGPGRCVGLLDLPAEQLAMAGMLAVKTMEREGAPRSALALLPRDRAHAEAALFAFAGAQGLPVVPIQEPLDSTTIRLGYLDRRLVTLVGGDAGVTEGEIEETLFAAGYEMVPGEVATWFRAVGEGATTPSARLLPLAQALAFAAAEQRFGGMAAAIGADVTDGGAPADDAPYLPVAQSVEGGGIWAIRMDGDYHERVVRTGFASGHAVAFPSLLAALDAWAPTAG